MREIKMKKISVFILGLVILIVLPAYVYAEEVQGQVQSINASNNEIIVKDSKSGADRAVTVHPKIASTLQQGSMVKISLKPGTNAADTVEVNIG